MSQIPADVRAAAEALCDRFLLTDIDAEEAFAIAIMGERERCAKIVEAASTPYLSAVPARIRGGA